MVMSLYDKTHTLFRIKLTVKDTIWGSEEIDMCKQYLGNTDPNQLLQLRKWFTCFDGIYVRNDCLNNELASWFALKAKV